MSYSEKYGTSKIYHSYVYRRWENLDAGRLYHFETRNLRKIYSLFQANPDPVMYLVRGNEIVARNDDYSGLASSIIYSPTISGSYLLMIRAYRTMTMGKCDLYRGVDGAAPTRIHQDLTFGGHRVKARWKSGESFETRLDGGSGDTYLYVIDGDYVGGHLYRDDDSGSGLCSKITPGDSGEGNVIVGSYSSSSQGYCRLYLFYKSYILPYDDQWPWVL